MKITDTIGRSMLVDLVYKDPKRGWLVATEHKLKGRGTRFLTVPHGEWAIRICSMKGADVIVHENGKRLISTSVPWHTQYITADSAGNSLRFAPAGEANTGAPATDETVHAENDMAAADDTTEVAPAEGRIPGVVGPFTVEDALRMTPPPLRAPGGHGNVYVVVRFAKEHNPHGEPPQEEFEISFQMLEPTVDAMNHFIAHLHILEEAEKLPNALDPFSRETPRASELANRPARFCKFCNHAH